MGRHPLGGPAPRRRPDPPDADLDRDVGPGLAAAEPVARSAGPLGWSELTIARELEHYRARVQAERDSQAQLTDETADGARLAAPDVRLAHA